MRACTGIWLVLLVMVNGCSDDGVTEDQVDKDGKTGYKLEASEKASLKEGDLLFRKGAGMVSNLIGAMQQTASDLSHCGILVRKDGQLKVVSAISSHISKRNGVHTVALDTFMAHSLPESLIVLRLDEAESGIPEQVASQALAYAEKGIPFDHEFDLKNDESLYCTELIYHILEKDLGLEGMISPGRLKTGKAYVGFKAFLGNGHFQKVLNHQAH